MLLFNLPFLISVGVYQRISPSQYSCLEVSGVPPPTKSPTSPKLFSTYSPSFSNSLNRNFGTFSPSCGKRFCIKPFLWSLSSSNFWLWDSIKSSKDERQEAIFCCSWGVGIGILI